MLRFSSVHLKRINNPYYNVRKNKFSKCQYLPTETSVMIFGSNTDVGKTIISTGLARAAIKSYKTQYIKPVQTGEKDENFIKLYNKPDVNDELTVKTLNHWNLATSPHIAAFSDGPENFPSSDNVILDSIRNEIKSFEKKELNSKKSIFTILETAGGVLSPGPNKTLQADMYRPLRLPIVLIGDSRLGGISATITAIESLKIRGYTIHAVVFIESPESETLHLKNSQMVQDVLEQKYSNNPVNSTGLEKAPLVFTFTPIPIDRAVLLHNWFEENDSNFSQLFTALTLSLHNLSSSYQEMASKGPEVIWWPFTQHGHVGGKGDTPGGFNDVTLIESAYAESFRTVETRRNKSRDGYSKYLDMIDACASWWTQGIGHGNSQISLSIAEAAGRYGHIMFPRNLHPPAVQLARFLVEKGPGFNWAKRVFYSDDGSTAMEVAIKMAFRLFDERQSKTRRSSDPQAEELVVISQEGAYHGDTLGTMNTAAPSLFNEGQHPWYSCSAFVLSVPKVGFYQGEMRVDVRDLGDSEMSGVVTENNEKQYFESLTRLLDLKERKNSKLAQIYKNYLNDKLNHLWPCHNSEKSNRKQVAGALLLEPLMLGAAGLVFIDPLYQKVLVGLCRDHGIPIVYDEVAVGFWRLGPISVGNEILQEKPDIAAYGKLLTGGYLPLAVTLATEETFNSFYDTDRDSPKTSALLHGHSYTASPLACSAALESIRIIEKQNTKIAESQENRQSSNFPINQSWAPQCFNAEEIRDLSRLPGVFNAMAMGSVCSVELLPKGEIPAKKIAEEVVTRLRPEGVYARPLGNVVYLMLPIIHDIEIGSSLVKTLKKSIKQTFESF